MCSASNDCAFRMAWTISSSSVMPTNPAMFMLVSFPRGRLAMGRYRASIAAKWIGSGGLASREKDRSGDKIPSRAQGSRVGSKTVTGPARAKAILRAPRPGKDLKFYLASPRYRDAKQESDKQACERSFPGNRANGRKRLSGLSRGCYFNDSATTEIYTSGGLLH